MGQQALWNVRIVHEGGIPESTVNTDRIADGS
jgi:hypothetical protein